MPTSLLSSHDDISYTQSLDGSAPKTDLTDKGCYIGRLVNPASRLASCASVLTKSMDAEILTRGRSLKVILAINIIYVRLKSFNHFELFLSYVGSH